VGLARLEIDGLEIELDQTDAALIAEEMPAQELRGRLLAAIIAPRETLVKIDRDPDERRRLRDAVTFVLEGGQAQWRPDLIRVVEALRE
jgi:hypothetical protein